MVVMWFFFGIVLALLMFRDKTVGVDVNEYIANFKNLLGISFENFFERFEDEYGYYILVKIIGILTKSEQLFLAIIGVICVIPVAALYEKNSENAMFTISIFYALTVSVSILASTSFLQRCAAEITN
jgi:hypothetical protein